MIWNYNYFPKWKFSGLLLSALEFKRDLRGGKKKGNS
jgi:hypothetical protein